ncbi:MAG: c-type cytochrome [Bauldia sp.]|nr:c-type cytochrome [Bauldia sp.]
MTVARRLVSTGVAASLLLAAGCDRDAAPQTRIVADGDPGHGRQLIAEVACGVCHIIPGVRGAAGTVGPSLAGFAERNLIAGVLPNTPSELARWVRDAPSLVPETAMPPMPLSEDEAVNVAAYLLTLR